jgi:uncharacterized membrane protein YhiD involved in acid resistance
MIRAILLTLSLLALPVGMLAQEQMPVPPQQQQVDLPGVMDNLQEEVLASVIRLPLAALLGAALALRPRRGGAREREPAVVQTQIILAVVGSLIMLVVGASLARAFGIVGAANLIRYRSKIDDPKDAVVMLCALSVGLASGVGLYGLAAIGTVFVAGLLWIIEGFEPQTRIFELKVGFGDKTQDLRPKVEEVLRRFKVKYELRTSAEDSLSYMATTPRQLRTDRVSNILMEMDGSGKSTIEWTELNKDKVPK